MYRVTRSSVHIYPYFCKQIMQLFIVGCYRRLHCGFLLGEGTGSAYGVVLVLDGVPKTNYAVV